MKPPTIYELLDYPGYRRYAKTIPVLSPTLQWGTPWAVYARLTDGRWVGQKYATYESSWKTLVKLYRIGRDKYEDIAIVSRRQLFGPPPTFREWDSLYFDWCGRCRRPSSFMVRPRHHALRDAPVLTTDEAIRCYYCGMRRCTATAYHWTPATCPVAP